MFVLDMAAPIGGMDDRTGLLKVFYILHNIGFQEHNALHTKCPFTFPLLITSGVTSHSLGPHTHTHTHTPIILIIIIILIIPTPVL